jgi:hypothetical protein
VRVGRDRGDARHAEVPGRHLVAEALDPGEQPAAEAAVDVHADAARLRELGDLLDGVDEAVRVVAGAADHGDRLVVDEVGHRGDVDDVSLGQGRMPHLDVHPTRTLVERHMRGHRHDDVRLRDAPLRPCVLPIGVQGRHETLRAAAGDDPDPCAVEQVRRHGDDLALELGGARVHVALQHVGVRVEVEDLTEEVVVGVVAGVETARDGAFVAEGVLALRHLAEIGEDRRVIYRLGRYAAVRRRRLPVRVKISENLRETVFRHLLHPSLVARSRWPATLGPAGCCQS